MTKFSWIRHAPSIPPGRVYGRTDADADVSDAARLAYLRQSAGVPDMFVRSPAQRCRRTLETLWPGVQPVVAPLLWEQDFGEFEGREFYGLPDFGERDAEYLAAYRWPGGESFEDLFQRVRESIDALRQSHRGKHILLVAHAGTIRAALAHALGANAASGLRFRVAPLALVAMTAYDVGWSIDRIDNP